MFAFVAIGLVATVAVIGCFGFIGENPMAPEVSTNTHIPAYVKNMFENWTMKHGKSYDSEDETSDRLSNFYVNVKKIQAHYEGEDKSYDLDLNKFADLSFEEFKI